MFQRRSLLTRTVSVFFITQFITSLLWATIAERHGRRLVLLVSLLGSAITCSLFGTSTSLKQAIATRLLQGVFAGAIGVARSAVPQITNASNGMHLSLEPRRYSDGDVKRVAHILSSGLTSIRLHLSQSYWSPPEPRSAMSFVTAARLQRCSQLSCAARLGSRSFTSSPKRLNTNTETFIGRKTSYGPVGVQAARKWTTNGQLASLLTLDSFHA